jgi:hypothetical protein
MRARYVSICAARGHSARSPAHRPSRALPRPGDGRMRFTERLRARLGPAAPVAAAWLVLGAVTTVPYARAALHPPPGRAFAGTFHWIDDFYNYVSFVQQSEDGRFLLQNKLLLSEHEPILRQPGMVDGRPDLPALRAPPVPGLPSVRAGRAGRLPVRRGPRAPRRGPARHPPRCSRSRARVRPPARTGARSACACGRGPRLQGFYAAAPATARASLLDRLGISHLVLPGDPGEVPWPGWARRRVSGAWRAWVRAQRRSRSMRGGGSRCARRRLQRRGALVPGRHGRIGSREGFPRVSCRRSR